MGEGRKKEREGGRVGGSRKGGGREKRNEAKPFLKKIKSSLLDGQITTGHPA